MSHPASGAATRRLLALAALTVLVIAAALALRGGDPGATDVATASSSPDDAVTMTATTAAVLGTTASAPATAAATPATAPTPTAAAPVAPTAGSATTTAVTDTVTFRRPINGNVTISLAWDCYDCVDWPTLRGKHHPAVDYVSGDKAIYATADGVVTKMNTGCGGQGCGNSYGNWLFLKHVLSDGSVLYSFYAHLESFTANVVDGACIRGGDRIGTMGNTGIASAAHLHFNIQSNTNLIDYTTQSTAVYGSRNPDTLYGKAKVKPC